MENIPYYDFSVFPLNGNKILEKIDKAVRNDIKIVLINFGKYFPWSIDNILRSEFSYSEKLIDKIVNICRGNDIILIPVLSVLINDDYIFNDYKYKYLTKDSIKKNILDISACGMGKLVEEMIDDLYSLFEFSNYILIELPDYLPEVDIKEWNETINHFLKRISNYLSDSGKNLILGCQKNCKNYNFNSLLQNVKYIVKKHIKIIHITHNDSYRLDIFLSEILIDGSRYQVSYLSSTDRFDAGLDAENILSDYNEADLVNVKEFYTLLDLLWKLIRTCWEELSLVYGRNETIYRIKFSRSVNLLNENYNNFTASCNSISDTFEADYQQGVIRLWLNAKKDSVLSQLNKLKDITRSIEEGFSI